MTPGRCKSELLLEFLVLSASGETTDESLAENRSLMIENRTGAAKDMLSDATKLQILEEPLHKVVLKPSTEWDLARSRYWICH